MGKVQGEEADPGCLSGLVSRLKAKVRSRPVASVPRPDNMNAASSNLCAADSTPLNSTSVAAHADDEPLHSCAIAVTPILNPGTSDPAPSSPVTVAVDAGENPPSDGLSHFSEENSLWKKAYNAANQETKKWIDGLLERNDISKSADSTQTEELIGVVRDIEKRHQDRAPRIRVGERDIFWKDYAPRVISSIQAIGDIAVQFAPAPTGIVWSALKTVLQMSVASGEELIAILGCSEKVLSIMRRGKVYEVIYFSASANTPVELREDLERRLTDVYTKSLELLAHVGQRLEKGYRHILLAIVNPGEAKGLIDGLIQCETDLVITAQACEAARSADADDRFSTMLSNLGKPLTQINDRVRDLLEEAEEKEILAALEFINHVDFGDQHRIRSESRTPETGEWLLRHHKFQEWEHAAASTILWLQGTVGMGKSFLASKVIDRFRVKTGAGGDHKSKSDQGLAFFYCNRGQIDLQDPLLTLRSFVRQLATCPRYSKMMRKSLIKLYRENRKNGLKLGFDACKEQLLASVNLYPQTIMILDGLDECDEKSRGKLITILANLVKDAQHPVKIFISSRREQDIVKLLPAESIIEIDANDNRDDIQKFVLEKMEEMERRGLWESIPDTLKSQIKNTLCKGSDGMFRWAYFQMEQLSECQQAKEIRDQLGKLPMSLNASYHELFTGMSSHRQETLRRAVMWVMCAYKPLPSNQLLPAVRLSISGDGATLDVEEELTEETLRSICHHLVIKDSRRDEWKFPHASVIEYFEKEHKWTIQEAHSFVAKQSLLCLISGYSKWSPGSHDDTDSEDHDYEDDDDKYNSAEKPYYLDMHPNKEEEGNPRHPLSSLQLYMRAYWTRHVRDLEGLEPHDVQLSRLVKRFMGFNNSLQQSSLQYRRWIEHEVKAPTYAYSSRRSYYAFKITDLFPSTNPIFAICTFGFYHILEDWRAAGVDISQVNRKGLDPLSIATMHRHQQICEKLIGLGADVNRVLRGRKTCALFEATKANNIDMVKFLLDKKADPNLPLKKNILCESLKHDLAITKALLDAGANPNTQCEARFCEFITPLENTGHHRYYEAASLLLQHKASVNLYPTRGQFGSPLAAAAYGGSIELVRLLIEHGADVNAPLEYGAYGSALAAGGVGRDNVEMVKYLIEEASADPSILSTNSPSKPPSSWKFSSFWDYDSPWDSAGYKSGKYLKEKGYVVDEDVLRKVGMWPKGRL